MNEVLDKEKVLIPEAYKELTDIDINLLELIGTSVSGLLTIEDIMEVMNATQGVVSARQYDLYRDQNISTQTNRSYVLQKLAKVRQGMGRYIKPEYRGIIVPELHDRKKSSRVPGNKTGKWILYKGRDMVYELFEIDKREDKGKTLEIKMRRFISMSHGAIDNQTLELLLMKKKKARLSDLSKIESDHAETMEVRYILGQDKSYQLEMYLKNTYENQRFLEQ